jgi:hypothetical protein
MRRKLLIGLVAPVFAFAMLGCDVDQTKEGKLPDVDVDVDGGQLPEFEVETADVDVDSKKVDVTVPDVDVDVGSKEVELTVPDVDVTMPDEKVEPGETPESQ